MPHCVHWTGVRGRSSHYRVTIRHGSEVEREAFESLQEAVASMEAHSREIQREGPLEEVNALRDYGPAQRVHARLEVSVGGLLTGREAGIDVMGDGSLVPYVGVIRKRRLEPSAGQTAFDAVRDALSNPQRPR